MDSTSRLLFVILLLIVLAMLPGLVGPWQLWHSMALMFLIGFGGLAFDWSRQQ